MEKKVIFETETVNGFRVRCNNTTFYGVKVIELHSGLFSENIYVLINFLGDLIAIFRSDVDMVCFPYKSKSFNMSCDVELR